MTFSDGTSLSAEDVVYSLEQAKGKGSIYRERLSDVTSITASGSTTVVIEINAADAAFDSAATPSELAPTSSTPRRARQCP